MPMPVDVIRRTIDLNLTSAILVARAAVRALSTAYGGSGGVIVNISSGAATRGAPGEYVQYAAAKAGVDALTLGLAEEVADQGIRANTVSPGNTYFEGGVWASIETGNPDLFKTAMELNPTGHMGTPEEVAGPVVFLASTAARRISGTNLVVDGALTRGIQL